MEATRGTALAATKKIYGTLAPTRVQGRRYAVEDRGNFVDKYRANPKLVEAGFTLNADMTFEDAPWFLDKFYRGAASGAGGQAAGTVTPSGSAGLGYTWAFVPDVNTDTLSTATLEVGDETVSWRGAFSTVDTADFTLPLDNALTGAFAGFAQDWLPQTSAFLGTAYTGFTGALSERTVESVMGWQARLYVDPDGATAGATQVLGRFKTAAWGYHNQNKKKYFGDGQALFTRLGRGRRQTHCAITFEGLDASQYADFYNTTAKAVRIQLIGGAITGSSLGTTTASPIAAGTVTSIPTLALAQAVAGGVGISVGGYSFAVTSAGAASSATAIPVISQVIPAAIPLSTTILAAKTQLYDFWGVWDTWSYGATDTNTTFAMDLQDVYSVLAGKESAVTIVNGSATVG